MNKSFIVLAFSLLIGFNSILISQTTADLFSIEGLSINSYHYNFFDGTWSTSYTFKERWQDNQGSDSLSFVRNHGGSDIILRIEGQKVYLINQFNPSDNLLYDFGWQVGDVITEGTYTDFEVSSVGTITLLDGEERKAISLDRGFGELVIVEGIGDIKNGLTPFFGDFEGYDVFVCAKIKDELLIQNVESDDSECEYYSCVQPIPDFEITTEDFTITTSNTSFFGNEFLWEFGDGQTSTEENPTHTYQNPGCYTITLNLGNDCSQNLTPKSIATSICINSAWEKEYENDSLRLSICPYDSDTDYAFSNDHLYKVTNGGDTWEELSITPDFGEKRRILNLDLWDENRGIAVTTQGPIVTEDGGQSWTIPVDEAYWAQNFVLEESGKAYVQRSVYLSYFFRTMDYGRTWETLDVDQTESSRVFRFLYAEDDLVYAHAFKGFWDLMDYKLGVSDDNGDTWRFLDLPFDGKQLQFVDNLNGFGTDNENVWHTSDGGLEWEQITNLHDISNIYFHSATHGWVMDNSGVVLYSTDRFDTYSLSACGDENFWSIRTLSDSVAIATKVGSTVGTEKYIFDQKLIGDCNSEFDNDNDGYSTAVDCDDANDTINPGAEEICDGIDNNCDGFVDEGFDELEVTTTSGTDYIEIVITPTTGVTSYTYLVNGLETTETSNQLFIYGLAPGDSLQIEIIPNFPMGGGIGCPLQPVVYYVGTAPFAFDCPSLMLNIGDPCDDGTPFTQNDMINSDCNCEGQLIIDEDGDGISADEDCDDTNANIFPGAEEICNDLDDDCDGFVDEGFTRVRYYYDGDGDGYGIPGNSLISCRPPAGYVTNYSDCDDNNSEISPGVNEAPYNGIDDDCNSATPDDDLDGDGYLLAEDCDDNDAAINPGTPEICDGLDNNCNDEADEGLQFDTYYMDSDLDGYGDESTAMEACSQPFQSTTLGGDCDDTDAAINPDAAEIPNNDIDENCDGVALIIDADNDGYNSDEDCDDDNEAIYPGNTETPYNGLDDDCDSATLDDDLDQDGFVRAEDCDDSNEAINPDAEEIANNGIDEDCDGMDLISALHELQNSTISIYPNPAVDIINIDVLGKLDYKASIYNLQGKLLLDSRNSKEIRIATLPSGVYLLEIREINSGQKIVEQIIKE